MILVLIYFSVYHSRIVCVAAIGFQIIVFLELLGPCN